MQRGDAVLDDLGKGPQDLLDRAGKDVDAADDQHVVGPAEDAAFQQREAASSPRLKPRPHDVARAVANDRAAEAAERREHQLGQLAVGGRAAGGQREELGDELGLDDVQAAARLVAIAPGADLRRAGVVDQRGRSRPTRSAAAGRAPSRPARRRR